MTAREYLVAMSAIWIIVVFAILIISHLAYGDANYCSTSANNHVEYCILNGKPIPCDTEIDQMLCQQVAEDLDDEPYSDGFCQGKLSKLDQEFCDQLD